MLADQVARADVAASLHLGEQARDHSTGLPRLPRRVGTTMARPSTGSNAATSLSISAGGDPRHVAEADDGRRSGGSAPIPTLNDVLRPSA